MSTDEIFGVAVSEPGKLNPFYNYGMMTVAIPGWSLGTFFGVIMGNILPANIVSALSVGLYGMFLAIIYHYSASKKKQGYCGSGHHLYGFQLHILTVTGDFQYFVRYPHDYSDRGHCRYRSGAVPGKGGRRT